MDSSASPPNRSSAAAAADESDSAEEEANQTTTTPPRSKPPAPSSPMMQQPSLTLIGAYRVSQYLKLFLLQGSVVDFGATPLFDKIPRSAAIVNAANEGCLGGSGVDGAISTAGGLRLYNARRALPIVQDEGEEGRMIRCRTGDAVLTGPNVFGDLMVPYVIHAVGPNYYDFDEDEMVTKGHPLLRSAYQSSLNLAYKHQIQSVGFSLLSSGIFRGPFLSLKDVLEIGLGGIAAWEPPQPSSTQPTTTPVPPDVFLCAFTAAECHTLVDLCEEKFSKLTKEDE